MLEHNWQTCTQGILRVFAVFCVSSVLFVWSNFEMVKRKALTQNILLQLYGHQVMHWIHCPFLIKCKNGCQLSAGILVIDVSTPISAGTFRDHSKCKIDLFLCTTIISSLVRHSGKTPKLTLLCFLAYELELNFNVALGIIFLKQGHKLSSHMWTAQL